MACDVQDMAADLAADLAADPLVSRMLSALTSVTPLCHVEQLIQSSHEAPPRDGEGADGWVDAQKGTA